MRIWKILPLFLLPFLFISCKNKPSDLLLIDSAKVDGHPAWIMQGNIYEVNIRQYTPEGTFKAFAKHLDRLKEMGVQTLWFMPINPISKVDRKGTLGSYYAVSDYKAINPEYGNLKDWKELVNEAHAKGFKVIIDWVPSHSGADHPWLTNHPDFYVKDSITGKAISMYDWTDTRKLNYKNKELVDSMIVSMKYWIEETDIDGYRCDVASEVLDSFWKECIPKLKRMKNIFMLAEADKQIMHDDGFDATYTWYDFNFMKQIAAGKRKASAFDSAFNRTDSAFEFNVLRMYFTSNHDENSWNKADFGTTPGASHAPFAVLTQTMRWSVPLIYSGQEEPVTRPIKFFDKDTITFSKFERAGFYQKLLELRKNNPALSARAPYAKLVTGNDDQIYAYVRQQDASKIVVILNLSNKPASFTLKEEQVRGSATEIFTGKKEDLVPGKSMSLGPWGYYLYKY